MIRGAEPSKTMPRPFVAVLLVLATAFAGCAGGAAGGKASGGNPTGPAAAPTVSKDTGSISGTVVNEEAAPVAGARIGIPDWSEETQVADAGGAFTFNGIPPGTYSVFAEQLGYAAKAQRVTIIAGEVTTVRFVLTALAAAGSARQLHYVADGFIELAFVVPGVGVFYANATGQGLNFVVYKVAEDAASSVMGLKWDTSAPLTGRYSRINTFLCKPATTCSQVNFTRGFSPIVIRMDGLQDSINGKAGYHVGAQWYPTTCQATSVELCVANPDTITAVTVNQRYKFYTSVFFVEPAPPDFDPTPG